MSDRRQADTLERMRREDEQLQRMEQRVLEGRSLQRLIELETQPEKDNGLQNESDDYE